jgi:ribonucleotide monophosphatase NagD (HAD superfamily)
VLVVGGRGLDEALREVGLRPVRSVDDDPAAVVQGFATEVGWRQLAEGTLGVLRGLPWIASNIDRTIPTARGIAPGNGTLVAAISAATGAAPEVAGKPELPLHEEAVRRTGARRPLVVGDRLDTDIEGANRAGVDSLLVLTGVCTPSELIGASYRLRPTYISESLAGLHAPHPEVSAEGEAWACGGWHASYDGEMLALSGSGERIDALRALCAAAWEHPDSESGRSAMAADATAALAQLGW